MYRDNTGKRFGVYQEKGSFYRASNQLTRFIAMCLRQVENSSSYPYHLPLQNEDVSLANSLWSTLKATELDLQSGISYLHQLFWSLCGSLTRREEELWSDPLKCFIAVLNLTEGGTFRTASLVTSDLSAWKHNLRAMVLHEIFLSKDLNKFPSQQV
jgi:hypothetical protein